MIQIQNPRCAFCWVGAGCSGYRVFEMYSRFITLQIGNLIVTVYLRKEFAFVDSAPAADSPPTPQRETQHQNMIATDCVLKILPIHIYFYTKIGTWMKLPIPDLETETYSQIFIRVIARLQDSMSLRNSCSMIFGLLVCGCMGLYGARNWILLYIQCLTLYVKPILVPFYFSLL